MRKKCMYVNKQSLYENKQWPYILVNWTFLWPLNCADLKLRFLLVDLYNYFSHCNKGTKVKYFHFQNTE